MPRTYPPLEDDLDCSSSLSDLDGLPAVFSLDAIQSFYSLINVESDTCSSPRKSQLPSPRDGSPAKRLQPQHLPESCSTKLVSPSPERMEEQCFPSQTEQQSDIEKTLMPTAPGFSHGDMTSAICGVLGVEGDVPEKEAGGAGDPKELVLLDAAAERPPTPPPPPPLTVCCCLCRLTRQHEQSALPTDVDDAPRPCAIYCDNAFDTVYVDDIEVKPLEHFTTACWVSGECHHDGDVDRGGAVGSPVSKAVNQVLQRSKVGRMLQTALITRHNKKSSSK